MEQQYPKTLSMTKKRVLLLGTTGETGGSILGGLLEDNDAFVCHYIKREPGRRRATTYTLARERRPPFPA
jgi:hypothetical protein